MIKLTAAVSRRDDWTREEWLLHYKERHGSLAASVPNFTRHSLRYLQNYAQHAPEIPDFPEADTGREGVTELWFPDIETLRNAYQEPDYLRVLRTDELRFCKFEDLAAGVAREMVLLDATVRTGDKHWVYLPRAKIFVFRTARAEIDRAQFQLLWQSERAHALMRTANFQRYVKRYVQSHMLDVDVGVPGGVSHALIDELWFVSTQDAVAYWTAYRDDVEAQRADAQYVKPGSTSVVFAREHEVFGPMPD